MGGWIDGWRDGKMVEMMNGWKDEWKSRCING